MADVNLPAFKPHLRGLPELVRSNLGIMTGETCKPGKPVWVRVAEPGQPFVVYVVHQDCPVCIGDPVIVRPERETSPKPENPVDNLRLYSVQVLVF